MTIFEIRDKLANDEIDYSDAFEQIKKFPKPWHTKAQNTHIANASTLYATI